MRRELVANSIHTADDASRVGVGGVYLALRKHEVA